MADAVETIKAQRMPDADGTRRHDLVGHVYYHPGDKRCGVPRLGEAYIIYPPPKNAHFSRPVTGTADAPMHYPGRGTGDDAGGRWPS